MLSMLSIGMFRTTKAQRHNGEHAVDACCDHGLFVMLAGAGTTDVRH